jgi:hypothetical protein
MKKTITIALLATMSAMFVAGFVSTLTTQQAYASNDATSATAGGFSVFGQSGSTAAGSTGGLSSSSGSGLGAETSGCFAFIGSCTSGENPED